MMIPLDTPLLADYDYATAFTFSIFSLMLPPCFSFIDFDADYAAD